MVGSLGNGPRWNWAFGASFTWQHLHPVTVCRGLKNSQGALGTKVISESRGPRPSGITNGFLPTPSLSLSLKELPPINL